MEQQAKNAGPEGLRGFGSLKEVDELCRKLRIRLVGICIPPRLKELRQDMVNCRIEKSAIFSQERKA